MKSLLGDELFFYVIVGGIIFIGLVALWVLLNIFYKEVIKGKVSVPRETLHRIATEIDLEAGRLESMEAVMKETKTLFISPIEKLKEQSKLLRQLTVGNVWETVIDKYGIGIIVGFISYGAVAMFVLAIVIIKWVFGLIVG